MNFILLCIILLISTAFGMRVLGLFKLNFYNFKEKSVFSLALGLGLLAYIVFALGLMGLLYKLYAISLLLLLAAFSYKEIVLVIKNSFSYVKKIKISELPLHLKIFSCFIFFSIILTFLGALAPPIGNDSLAYRLAQIRIFSTEHRFFYIPYTRESLWPYLMESLFALVLVIKSDIALKLIAWSCGVLLAFLIYIFTEKNFSKKAAMPAACVFLLTPAIFTQMTYAYVDIPLALYSFISLVSIMEYFKQRNPRWIILAGVFCGFTLSIKYVGVFSLLCLLVIFIFYAISLRERYKYVLKNMLLFLLFAALFSFIWYLRSYIIKSNPLYPFFAEFFNGNGWSKSLEANIAKDFSFLSLLRLPWAITMFPKKFGGEHFGVIYLLLLPLLCVVKEKKHTIRVLCVFALCYVLIWYFVDQYVIRFLFPILPILSILIGVIIFNIFKKHSYFYNLVKMVLIAVCLFNSGLLLYHNADKLKVSLGIETRQNYLSRIERTYDMAEYISHNLPLDATILMLGEIRAYYMKRPYIHIKNLINEDKIPISVLRKKNFSKKLKSRNITHILYAEGEKESVSYAWVQSILNNNAPIFTSDFIDKDNKKHSLVLYSIE